MKHASGKARASRADIGDGRAMKGEGRQSKADDHTNTNGDAVVLMLDRRRSRAGISFTQADEVIDPRIQGNPTTDIHLDAQAHQHAKVRPDVDGAFIIEDCDQPVCRDVRSQAPTKISPEPTTAERELVCIEVEEVISIV